MKFKQLFKLSHAFTAKEMFLRFNFKSLSWWRKKQVKRYKWDTKEDLVGAILTYCFQLIILDIIENNVNFVLPVIGRKAVIYVRPITGKTFEYLYREGSFEGLDFLKTNFIGYRLTYRYQIKGGIREKPIHVNRSLKQRLFENANNGMIYY